MGKSILSRKTVGISLPVDNETAVASHLTLRFFFLSLNVKPEIQYYSQGEREKVFFRPNNRSTKTSYPAGRYPWGWPSVDVGFYVIDNQLMAHEYGCWKCKFKLKDVFPVTYRPMGKLIGDEASIPLHRMR